MISEPTEVQTYRALDALNYSMLADWKGCPGNLTIEKKVTAAMELGTAGHLLLQDVVTDNGCFHNHYFTVDGGELPDSIVQALKSDVDLTKLYHYTKSGALDGRYKAHHAYLDQCIDNPGKMPISQENYAALSAGIENLLKTEFMGLAMSDYFEGAEWEKPFTWKAGDQKKKALFDIVSEVEVDGKPTRFCFDPKYSNSFRTFESMFSDRYWIQAQHYAEGAEEYTKSLKDGFDDFGVVVFLVIQVTPPYWCRPYIVEPDINEDMRDDYLKLCYDFNEWVDEGKPQSGFMPVKSMRWWRR